MKKLNLTALLVGAALLTGLGVTSASAESMKCGAGKCGSSMQKPAKSGAKCGADKKAAKGSSKCGANKKDAKGSSKCGAEKKSAKCGAGKCGGNK